MNGREMFRQTTKKPPNTSQATEQTDGQNCRQTLAAQISKSSLSSNGKRQRRLKNDLTFNIRIPRKLEFIQFVFSVRNIPNTICKIASKFEKEILKIGHRRSHVLSNKQNLCGYFTLLFCELLLTAARKYTMKCRCRCRFR